MGPRPILLFLERKSPLIGLLLTSYSGIKLNLIFDIYCSDKFLAGKFFWEFPILVLIVCANFKKGINRFCKINKNMKYKIPYEHVSEIRKFTVSSVFNLNCSPLSLSTIYGTTIYLMLYIAAYHCIRNHFLKLK